MTEVGDVLQLGTQIYDSTGALADGGTVTVELRLNGAVVASTGLGNLPIAHPSLGLYRATWLTLEPGVYVVTWIVTGANAGASSESYQVEYPAVGIVSLDEVRQALKIRRTDTDDDLMAAILQASDICEGPEGTCKTWRRTVVTDEIQDGGASFQLSRNPIIEITAMSVDGTPVVISDYDVNLKTGRVFGVYSTGRRGRVKVSYVAGITGPVPAGVREGCIEMVRHLMASRRGGSGIPRQDEPDFSQGPGYLIPNRVVVAWRGAAGPGL